MDDDGLRAVIAGSFPFDLGERRLILVTGHRRESFGEGFERICQALSEIATRFPDVDIVYPVHLNPNVREPVMRWLSGIDNIHLIETLRSEEHQSELQSLLRISYSVLWFK